MGMSIPGWAQDTASAFMQRFNQHVFRSAPGGAPLPRTPGSWSFAAIGDFGAGTRAQLDVARNVLAGPQQIVLTLGDTVYESGLESEYAKHFDPPERFGEIRRRYPVYPTVGNHDIAGGGVEPYHRRFPEAKGRNRYVFEHGGVRFFSLDSNRSLAPGSEQWAWLERELSQAWEGWKVVYLHHPLLSGMPGRTSGNAHAPQIAELLGRHGVDLLIAGHDHAYERTKPLNDYGTIQVTAGNGGRMLYPFLTKQPDWSAHRETVHGHLDVEVTPGALVVRHVRRDGSVGDTHAITTRSRAAGQSSTPSRREAASASS